MAAVTILLLAVMVPARADSLQMVGKARLEVLFWPVYESRLYSADGSYREGQRPLRLEIQYLRNFDAEDLVERTGQEWQGQGLTHPAQQQWLARLAQLWPDVRENDVLALALDQDGGSAFYLNGELLGTIADPDFGGQFVDIWLSTKTSRPEMRLALIGQ